MTEERFFYDTYAFFEMEKGNPNYEKYCNANAITTIFNLAELNWVLKREGKKYADELVRKNEPLLVEVSVEDIMHAMDIRMKRRNLSIPDAVGYAVAGKYHARFLTGDKDFEGLPNVEFVK